MAVYFLEWQEVFKCLFVILSLNFNLWKKEVSVDNNPLLFTITKSNSSNWFHHHWRKWANCKNWETLNSILSKVIFLWRNLRTFALLSKCKTSKLSSVLLIAVSFIYILIFTECCIWWFASNIGVYVTFVEACFSFPIGKNQELLSFIVLTMKSAIEHENIEILEEMLFSVKPFQIISNLNLIFVVNIGACFRGSITAFSVS